MTQFNHLVGETNYCVREITYERGGTVEIVELEDYARIRIRSFALVPLIDALEAIAQQYNLRPEARRQETSPTTPRMPMLEELANGQLPTMGVPTHREDETAS